MTRPRTGGAAGPPTDPDVAASLAAADPAVRARLERIRALVLEAAPGATDVISYRMPALRFEGRMLVWYAAFRHHVSLFPASDAVKAKLGEALRPYLSGRGTVHFRHRDPLPEELVRAFVEARIDENRAARRARGRAADAWPRSATSSRCVREARPASE